MNIAFSKSPIKAEDLPPPESKQTGWPWTDQRHQKNLPFETSNYPLISIVTPSYNQGEFIEETIRSVLLQNYPKIEYIVIDGGSSDRTLEILEKYNQWISYWVSEPDQGPADAINKGWKRAAGSILAYINSDDAYLPDALFVAAQAFLENPEAAVVCGNEVRIDKHGFLTGKSDAKDISYLSLLNLEFIPQPATFIQRKALEAVESINSKISYIFDFELWIKIARHYPIKRVDYYMAATRWHEQTITTKQRLKVGQELVNLITDELEKSHLSLSKTERDNLLIKVNLLAGNLCVETGNFPASFKYVRKAFSINPQGKLLAKIIVAYWQSSYLYLRKLLPLDTSLFANSEKHWSEIG
ncbi:glycosyltransferase family 2 protein [Sphaerothrix gracilis]|uniref:glycosyltransferase family 2 protein n=1 Tax=Sphaerothrix gracilis TaxID=3151835 RepID=UPI0031FC8FE6